MKIVKWFFDLDFIPFFTIIIAIWIVTLLFVTVSNYTEHSTGTRLCVSEGYASLLTVTPTHTGKLYVCQYPIDESMPQTKVVKK